MFQDDEDQPTPEPPATNEPADVPPDEDFKSTSVPKEATSSEPPPVESDEAAEGSSGEPAEVEPDDVTTG